MITTDGTVYVGAFVDTPALGVLRWRDLCVRVDGTGTVVAVVPLPEVEKKPLTLEQIRDVCFPGMQCEVRDLRCGAGGAGGKAACVFLPGFIDTHIHASQYANCGLFGSTTLLDWLNKYTFPLEASLADLQLAREVYGAVVSSTLRNGTTTAVYYATIDAQSSQLLATLCSELNQRAFVGKVCMDREGPDFYLETTEQSLIATEKLVNFCRDKLQDDKVRPILTPRFAPTCSPELLSKLGAMSKSRRIPIQTHLSENEREIKWVAELFPECSSYTDVYHKHGLLDKGTVLAHCVHLSREEIQLVKETGAGISHCPISNSCLTSGECPVRHLLQEGIPIGLGTDVSGGYSTSILATARHAHLVSRHVTMKQPEVEPLTVAECLYLATLGGATALNMQDELGTFDVGKKFDAQLLDLGAQDSPVDLFSWQGISKEDVLSKWFFNGDDRNVKQVWVQGRSSL
ncbi:guanine deaminase KNAG_0E02920 [Huiozyma naganishii CBS 8797]|uniref:Guanine deaminase n=1 Tax=Huiozyma naganishii (strain ATCC MYA-139 / BCRC 22969 / CBS 8797 / KCTC 17520 / NBRC 10181 / NCYC 3082 / Yp74L-3) TaxID=1071383 RepID=J7S7X3_HUIN7|nr:hypothetical protein KNAG_0E02920 [Kazachstania naganishii CBS 8797]CCK70551.1 hypothetical protein KNAG_0E02920 [Kazachstania naganishii CBS 8797]